MQSSLMRSPNMIKFSRILFQENSLLEIQLKSASAGKLGNHFLVDFLNYVVSISQQPFVQQPCQTGNNADRHYVSNTLLNIFRVQFQMPQRPCFSILALCSPIDGISRTFIPALVRLQQTQNQPFPIIGSRQGRSAHTRVVP